MFVVLVVIIGGSLYWIAKDANRRKSEELELINRNYDYAKGVITGKESYKGHSIEVKYQIGNREYHYVGGWDSNPHNLREGDSIRFRYAIDTPQIIITELDDRY